MSTVPLGTKYSAKILRPPAPWDKEVACSNTSDFISYKVKQYGSRTLPETTDIHELGTNMFIFFKAISCDYLSKRCENKSS